MVSWKLSGWILLVAMVASLPAQSPAVPLMHEKPAGCHQHGNSGPARLPSDNHGCCVAGHDSAIIQPSAAPQVTLRPVPNRMTAAEFSPPSFLASTNIKFPSSAAPPGATPLRI